MSSRLRFVRVALGVPITSSTRTPERATAGIALNGLTTTSPTPTVSFPISKLVLSDGPDSAVAAAAARRHKDTIVTCPGVELINGMPSCVDASHAPSISHTTHGRPLAELF